MTSSSCVILQPVIGGGAVSADASTMASLVGNMASQTISTDAGYTPPDLNASASAQADQSVSYNSSGTVRSGFIDATINLYSSHYFNSEGAALMISDGNLYYGFDAISIKPAPGDSCSDDGCTIYRRLPFNLGESFAVSLSSKLDSPAGSCSGGCPNADGSISFSLTEADGKTPVAFSATPEPASFALLGFTLLILVALRRHVVQRN